MKTRLLVLVGLMGFVAATSVAMPLTQHRARGSEVQAVDREKSIITLTPLGKSEAEQFVVQTGRTRLKCDGRRAILADLSVGTQVRVYYRRERGKLVATEINWKATQSPQSMISSPDRW